MVTTYAVVMKGRRLVYHSNNCFIEADLYNAQKYLVQEFDNLAIYKGYRIVCVFDADRASTSGTDKAEMTESGVWVVSLIKDEILGLNRQVCRS